MATFTRKPRIDVGQIHPTSKLTLKLTCLAACDNDVRRAAELYDFLAGDMTLPDMEPQRPDTIGQIKQSAGEVFGWIQNHRDDLIQGYNFIKGIKRPAGTIADVPPIPDIR